MLAIVYKVFIFWKSVLPFYNKLIHNKLIGKKVFFECFTARVFYLFNLECEVVIFLNIR